MIELRLVYFLVLLELIGGLLLIIGYQSWRLRRLMSKGNGIQFIDATEDYPKPAFYLDREAARTRALIEALHERCPPVLSSSRV